MENKDRHIESLNFFAGGFILSMAIIRPAPILFLLAAVNIGLGFVNIMSKDMEV